MTKGPCVASDDDRDDDQKNRDDRDEKKNPRDPTPRCNNFEKKNSGLLPGKK